MTQTVTQEVPKAALRHRSTVQFAKPKAVEGDAGGLPTRAVKLLARTGDSLYHWWWGKIVHDMAGFKAKHDSIAIDYVHDDKEILGFCNGQSAAPEGLTLSGELTPFLVTDRASEVSHKFDMGVPYQASIDWSGDATIEWVPEGMTAEANDQSFSGPCAIVRQWSLEGVAICPHGADDKTETELFSGEKSQGDAKLASVKLFTASGSIPTQFTNPMPTAPQNTPAASAAPSQPALDHTAFKAELKRFTDRFGPEAGLTHFNAGTSYEAALEHEFSASGEKHKAEVKKLTDENASLQTKLSLVNKGEASPVQHTDGDAPGSTTEKNAPKGVASFIRIKK